jgi:hypothetical protein
VREGGMFNNECVVFVCFSMQIAELEEQLEELTN